MQKTELLALLRKHKWAIEATASESGKPQAAIIGFAVTEELELVFDTLASTRKAANLRVNPEVAVVIGGWSEGNALTIQYEGLADFPDGEELERVRHIYFGAFTDGPSRLSWPGITYVRVAPRWVRVSNFNVDPPDIEELRFEQA